MLVALFAPAAGGDPRRPANLVDATVVRVDDGDTLRVRLGRTRERVRLIGIDTPEAAESDKLDRDAARSRQSRQVIMALGRRAAAFTRERLEHRRVGLEFDVERRDRFGRLLAYVWLPDGSLFNATLAREGYAEAFTVPPNVRYGPLFVRLQRAAREEKRGLWGRGWVGSRARQRTRGG